MDTSVLIIGAGPVGLTMAHNNQMHVPLLPDDNPGSLGNGARQNELHIRVLHGHHQAVDHCIEANVSFNNQSANLKHI